MAAVMPSPHQARLPVRGAMEPMYRGTLVEGCAWASERNKSGRGSHRIMLRKPEFKIVRGKRNRHLRVGNYSNYKVHLNTKFCVLRADDLTRVCPYAEFINERSFTQRGV